ncbi:LPXTG cell wall anchor domain-containing protein [Streptomyces prunicolor]|uniref:LAETG motif-containing sortase-dependent surface protein n=1 Tax=Streptomyces prunicolor TaxID=67348 RepID=UPI0022574DEB|nr:LAETG motif-containing sortase-dependent surface protein [Streptomyces prunicolor]MCX5235941.1 LPXTG cell wall anchor domain-containing protein [Streptomyces prunicolor]
MQTPMQIPTRRSPSWRRPSAIATTAAMTVLGLGMASAPASASTYDWSVSCSQVTVDLKGYNPQVVQIVEVTADGKELGTELSFRDDFHHTYAIPTHSKPLSIRFVVTPGSEDGQAVDETKTSPVCGEGSASPTSSPTPSASTPATAASSGTPSDASSTLSSPSPSSYISAPPLAETGASGSTPLIAGTAGAVVLAGAALLVVTRRRRATQH